MQLPRFAINAPLTLFSASSLSSKVPDILICAAEYLRMPVRRTDEEPLQKLMTELRGDLDSKARLVLCTHRPSSSCCQICHL